MKTQKPRADRSAEEPGAALMRAALSPGCIPPGSRERGSCLPSCSAPRGAGVTLSPPASLSSHRILPCSLYTDTPHLPRLPEKHRSVWDVEPRHADATPARLLGLVALSRMRFVLFPLWLSLVLFEQNSTSFPLPQFDKGFVRVIFSKLFFTVICTFIISSS